MCEAVRDAPNKLPNSRDLLRLSHSIISNRSLAHRGQSARKMGTSGHKLVFSLILTLAFACSTASQIPTAFVTTSWLSKTTLRSRALTSFPLLQIPDTGTLGRGAVCMVHKVAQEASRRITPARALAHAVAPPLDRTFRI